LSTDKKRTANIGFAARLAGRWSNGHFIAVVLHLGWTFNLGLLFVNLYFYIFNQQRFRAGRAMNSSPAASPARWWQGKKELHLSNKVLVWQLSFYKVFG
jgi:hypothetical protein